MSPTFWEIVGTVPGAVVCVVIPFVTIVAIVWVLLRGRPATCDCTRKIVRRQDPEDGWAVIVLHRTNCPFREGDRHD